MASEERDQVTPAAPMSLVTTAVNWTVPERGVETPGVTAMEIAPGTSGPYRYAQCPQEVPNALLGLTRVLVLREGNEVGGKPSCNKWDRFPRGLVKDQNVFM